MKKKRKFLIGIMAAISVSALAVAATGCNLADDIKTAINQARCEHEWNDGEITKESTCTEKGELTKTCALCEKVETEEIELANHVAVYVEAVTPTCVEKGKTDGTVCAVCETEISGFQELPAIGHLVVEIPAIAVTCLENGLTDGAYCSRCDEVLLQQSIIPATGHHILEFEEVPATCYSTGFGSGVKCELCNTIYSGFEIIPTIECVDKDSDSACDFCGDFFLPS